MQKINFSFKPLLQTKSYKLKAHSGFSLMEFIVYVALLGGVSVFIAGAFISVNQSGAKAQARYAVNSNIRYALNTIDQDVKDASAIENPVPTLASTTLTLQIGSDEITYDLSGQRLRRKVTTPTSTGTPQNITSDNVNVTSINFRLFQNPNLPLLKRAINLNTIIAIEYDSDSPDYSFSETLSKTSFLERISNWPLRGEFGSTTGNSNPPCVSRLEAKQRFAFIRLIKIVLAIPDPCPPEGIPLPDVIDNL